MEQEQIIKTTTEEFLRSMGFQDFSIETKRGDGANPWVFKITIPTAGQLIGNKGANIVYLEHIIKIMVKRKIAEGEPFVLDINDYRKSKESFLKEIARMAAQKVVLSGREEALPPMTAYERRIIHLELSMRPDVVTESLGEGTERHLVIKPNIA